MATSTAIFWTQRIALAPMPEILVRLLTVLRSRAQRAGIGQSLLDLAGRPTFGIRSGSLVSHIREI